jgi:hypothetical protein
MAARLGTREVLQRRVPTGQASVGPLTRHFLPRTSLAAMGTDAILEQHLGAHPDVLEQLNLARDAAWSVTDNRLLGLCEQRIREILGVADESQLANWWADASLSKAEKACLAFTEEYMIDVASLSDESAASVRNELGDQAMVDFVSALLVVEQRQRIALAWATVFGDTK